MNQSTSHKLFRATKQFSELVSKYQENDASVAKYISGFPSIENFKKQIAAKQNVNINRNLLADELLLQYKTIEDKKRTLTQIENLRNNNTFTVTTGHQCSLFTGPLYFIFKIISAINLAKELQAKIPGNNFVPVFWMATEDHDFAEINHINLLNKKIEYNSSELGNAVGRIALNNIETTISEIEEVIQNFEYGKTAIEILKKAYQSDNNIATATRIFVHELFKNDGLVILDADSMALKSEFKNIIAKDISENKNIDFVTSNTNHLIADGLIDKPQITPRSVNFFLLDNSKRLRIDRTTESTFTLKDSDEIYSNESLQELIQSNPEMFSPNVVMRPMYQETILPNLAYIGGGAEFIYWMQLKEMFVANNIIFPLLMLRNSALILEKNTLEKFLNLGFVVDDVFEQTLTLQKKYLKANTVEISFDEELSTLKKIFSELKQKAIVVEKTLENTVEAEFVKTNASIKNIEQKILKAQKRNEETSLLQIEKFKQKYFPNNELQERNDNFLYYFAKYGFDFLDYLKAELNPIESKFVLTVLE